MRLKINDAVALVAPFSLFYPETWMIIRMVSSNCYIGPPYVYIVLICVIFFVTAEYLVLSFICALWKIGHLLPNTASALGNEIKKTIIQMKSGMLVVLLSKHHTAQNIHLFTYKCVMCVCVCVCVCVCACVRVCVCVCVFMLAHPSFVRLHGPLPAPSLQFHPSALPDVSYSPEGWCWCVRQRTEEGRRWHTLSQGEAQTAASISSLLTSTSNIWFQ